MIVDVLANSERIEGLNPYFKVVFDYIKTHDLASMPVGRIDIDGDNAYLKIEDAKGRKTEEAVYERHDKYIDFTFYRDPVERVFTLSPGEFVIFFPEDAHAPCIGEGVIRKVVAKVRKIENWKWRIENEEKI